MHLSKHPLLDKNTENKEEKCAKVGAPSMRVRLNDNRKEQKNIDNDLD
jgi:hypothetical protein